MSQIIPITVEDDAYAILLDAPLGLVSVSMDLRWREAAAGWYLSASLPDGTSLARGVRLSPGGPVALDLSVDGAPDGLLYCIGGDDLTVRQRLGVSVFLAWVPS